MESYGSYRRENNGWFCLVQRQEAAQPKYTPNLLSRRTLDYIENALALALANSRSGKCGCSFLRASNPK
jgi:hypothetical protein